MAYSSIATLSPGPLPLAHYNALINNVAYSIARPYGQTQYSAGYSSPTTGNWNTIIGYSTFLTTQVAGRPVLVLADMGFSVDAASVVFIRVRINGSTDYPQSAPITCPAGYHMHLPYIALYAPPVVGTYVLQIDEYHTVGTLTMTVDNVSTIIAMEG